MDTEGWVIILWTEVSLGQVCKYTSWKNNTTINNNRNCQLPSKWDFRLRLLGRRSLALSLSSASLLVNLLPSPITVFLATSTLFSSLSSFKYLFLIAWLVYSFLWLVDCFELLYSFFLLSVHSHFLIIIWRNSRMEYQAPRNAHVVSQTRHRMLLWCLDFHLLDINNVYSDRVTDINIDFSPAWLAHWLLMRDWVLDGFRQGLIQGGAHRIPEHCTPIWHSVYVIVSFWPSLR